MSASAGPARSRPTREVLELVDDHEAQQRGPDEAPSDRPRHGEAGLRARQGRLRRDCAMQPPATANSGVSGSTGPPCKRLIAGNCYRAAVDTARRHDRPPPDDGPASTRPSRSTRRGSVASRIARRGTSRNAWRRAGRRRIGDQLLLLEHPAVLTLGRTPTERTSSPRRRAWPRRGIEVLRVERGGEVTYHGPGQLVAYPIVALRGRGLLLRPFVRALERAMVATCAAIGVAAAPSATAIPAAGATRTARRRARSAALGIRVERGVSYHGIALNVDPDLADFDLIDPCGMPGVASTSIARERGAGDVPPSTDVGGARPRRPSPPRWPHALGADRCAGPLSDVAAGLFELRKDPITGWWVATVVDRAFHRDRFARAGRARRRSAATARTADCPTATGIRVRMLKDFAFHVVGTERRSPRAGSGRSPRWRCRRRGRAGAGGRSSRRRASIGRSTPSATRSSRAWSGRARTRHRRTHGRPARPTTSRSSRTGAPRPARGRTTSASTSTTSRRSRTASRRSWAAPPGS